MRIRFFENEDAVTLPIDGTETPLYLNLRSSKITKYSKGYDRLNKIYINYNLFNNDTRFFPMKVFKKI